MPGIMGSVCYGKRHTWEVTEPLVEHGGVVGRGRQAGLKKEAKAGV